MFFLLQLTAMMGVGRLHPKDKTPEKNGMLNSKPKQ